MRFADIHVLATPHGPLWLQRAWPRSDEHVLLELGTAGGEIVGGQWLADPARRCELLRSIGGAVFEVPGTGVVVQPEGADRRLPGLAPLLAEPGAVLMSHRPERRAVVRRGDGAYVKVVRPGRTAEIVAAAARAAEGAGERWFTVPRLVAHDPERGLLVWSALRGETLHDVARADGPAGSAGSAARGDGPVRGVVPAVWARAWARVGVAVRHLHEVSPTGLPVRTLVDELRAAQRWLAPASALGLLPEQLYDEGRADTPRAGPIAGSGRPRSVATLHGDLHDKQLLVKGPGVPGILDLDTLAAGDPALDVANLLVHLDLRVAQGLMKRVRADQARAAFLSGYAPDELTTARVPAYAELARLRLAGLYAFRPRWRSLAADLARRPRHGGF